MTARQERKPFDADGAQEGAQTSLDVLLSWVRCDGNYARWRGANRQQGNSKEELCRELVGLLHTHGLTHRTTRDVRNKIAEFERAVRHAVAWKNTMGKQTESPASEAEIRVGLIKCCKYYDALAPIMAPFISSEEPPAPISRDDAASVYRGGDLNGNLQGQRKQIHATANATIGNTPKICAPSRIPIPRAAVVPRTPVENPRPRAPVAVQVPARIPMSRAASAVIPSSQPRGPVTLPNWPASPLKPTIVPGKRNRESNEPSDEGTPQMEQRVRKSRLQLEARRLALEDERLKLELHRQQIQFVKEKALARQELRDARIPEEEINRVFPY